MVAASRSRARSMTSSGKRDNDVPATNTLLFYTADMTVGNQEFTVIVDTGSANSDTIYVPSSSSRDTGAAVEVDYGGGGFFKGEEFTDTVSLGDLTVTAQSIGVARSSFGFDFVDGIMAFGPEELTSGTVQGADIVPTFMQGLVSQGQITQNVLGVSFEPLTGSDEVDINGELTLGGVDDSKHTGTITYIPRSQVSPFNSFWGVDVTSTTFGSAPIGVSFSTIIDTVSLRNTYLPIEAFNDLLSVGGGTVDENNSGILVFPTLPTDNIAFNIAWTPFILSPDQYLFSEDEIALLELAPFSSVFMTFGEQDPNDLFITAIMGQRFLENFYSVYDSDNNVVGLAPRA